MNSIFEEIIQEASIGRVVIGDEEWPITFNTKVYESGYEKETYMTDDSFSTLIVRDKDVLVDLLEEYLDIELEIGRKTPNFVNETNKNKIKWIVSYLFANARTQDFMEPENYVRKMINFLNDTTFDYLNEGIEINTGDSLFNSKLKIQNKKASTSMETPYKMELTLKKEIDGELVEYSLPTIYYGISDNTCYIYSLLNPREKKDISPKEKQYQKKINRLLYRLNEGIEECEEYYAYKEGNSDYYPENISDITHSFVLALTIFLTLLEMNNIQKVKAVPYLPVRYASRFITASRLLEEHKRKELFERNNRIQQNITDKFIRTFRRVTYHDKSVRISSYPYEIDEYLTISLDPKLKDIDNEIIEDAINDMDITKITGGK